MSFNPSQREAIRHKDGPMLVLAGPGSGKTLVITERTRHLITEYGINPANILVITFTRAAATEMKERFLRLMGGKSSAVTFGTFHAVFFMILKHAYHYQAENIIREEQRVSCMREIIKRHRLEYEDESEFIAALLGEIGLVKNSGISLDHYYSTNCGEEVFRRVYSEYHEYLYAHHLIDFEDMLLYTWELFKERKDILAAWQKKYPYILIDEFQDINQIQFEVVRLLAGEQRNLFVVGDDDQSIYSWRGARPQNLVLLSQDFPALQVIKLEQNYRSSGRILKAANILIANNPHVFEKRLFSELGYGAELKVLSANNEDHEAERVAGELIAHHFINKTNYKDYAILYRGNHQSRVFEKMLMQNRIPYKISGGTSFFSRPEIKDLLAYLRVLTNPDDDSAFLRIVNTPKREIGPATLQKLGEWAMGRNKGLFTASFDMGLSQTLTGRGYESLTRFTHWLREIQQLAEREPVNAVRDLIRGIDYESWLYETSPSPKAAEMRMKNVNQLFTWMTEMLEGSEIDEPMTLTQVVTRFTLRDMMERGESDEELDQVQLMTLHASKGLEFPYVYLVGMEEGLLPHQSSIDEDNVDEERRLAYVGITRAQKELTFTLCKERRQYGELVRPEPSRFLLELPQDDLIWEQARKTITPEERMQKGQANVANIRAMLAKAKKA